VGGAVEDRERAAKVARAWTLHGQRWSSREIGADLGVSHRTAQLWVEEARQALEWSEITERAGRRARMVEVLDQIARIGVERLVAVDEETGQPVEKYKDVAPALLGYLQEINRVEGNYAPIRTVNSDDRRPPDPALVAAMRAEASRAAALDEAEARRELEQ